MEAHLRDLLIALQGPPGLLEHLYLVGARFLLLASQRLPPPGPRRFGEARGCSSRFATYGLSPAALDGLYPGEVSTSLMEGLALWSDPDRNYGPPLPRELKKRVMRAHNGVCHVCGKPGSDEIDHILNRASGGSDEWENLAPIHKAPCHVQKTQGEAQRARNARKHRKPPEHPGRKRK